MLILASITIGSIANRSGLLSKIGSSKDSVEDKEAEPIDWNKDAVYENIFEYSDMNNESRRKRRRKNKRNATSGTKESDLESAKTVPLSTLPPGMVILVDAPFRDSQIIDKDGEQSKYRPNAVSPREYIRGKIALLQVTSSPPTENPIDHKYYDVRYEHITNDCGLDHPSTIKCAEIYPLPPNYQIPISKLAGSLTDDSETWGKIVKMCDSVPDGSIVLHTGIKKLNCSTGSSDTVIAYVVMPNY